LSSELLAYIVETKIYTVGPVIYRLADLVFLYRQCLDKMGIVKPDINSTRLKDTLLAEVPELEAHKKGWDVPLAFKSDISEAVSKVSDYSEAIILAGQSGSQ
jgi:hypothetical protein